MSMFFRRDTASCMVDLQDSILRLLSRNDDEYIPNSAPNPVKEAGKKVRSQEE